MYDHREMNMNRKLKIISILYFYVKKGKLHLQETEKTHFANYLRRRQMFFVAMKYRAAALFPLFLHGKERLFSPVVL